MPAWDDDDRRSWSAPVLAPERPDRPDERAVAHRDAPTFGRGPDDPTIVQSLRQFARRYGWRAYALPVLSVITVLALMTAGSSDRSAGSHQRAVAKPPAPPTASANISLKSDQPGSDAKNTALSAQALPPGAPYTEHGSGTFRVLPGSGPQIGTGTLHRYTVEVENGITGVDLGQFARQVQQVLSDPRSWAGHNGVALQRVDSGAVDFHVTLASSDTVHQMCGNTMHIETSCYLAAGTGGSKVNRVDINVARWVRGDAAYVGDLNAYRTYVINHEDGHALGHEHAHQCLPGGLAPVMMQQTIGLRSAATKTMCESNPWPFPPGVKGAPGAEQPDTNQNSEYGLRSD